MRPDYPNWLAAQKYSENTQTAQIHRVKKVEECYGNLDLHFADGSYPEVIASLEYSTNDERTNKPHPSKIKFEGNVRTNLQSYKSAVVRYRKFLEDVPGCSAEPQNSINENAETPSPAEGPGQQRFTLERDMQAALRRNITSRCWVIWAICTKRRAVELCAGF